MAKREKNGKINGFTPGSDLKKSAWNSLLIKYLIGIISLICVMSFVYKTKPQTQPILSAGEIANQDIRAEIDFSYTDKKATDSLREQAVANVPAIYYLDEKIKTDADTEINKLFFAITEKEDTENIKRDFTWLSDEITLKVLQQLSNPDEVKENVLKTCGELLDKGIITNSLKIRIISRGKDVLSIYDPETKTINDINIEKFILFDDLNQALDSRLGLGILHPFNRHLRQAVKYILLKQLKPNVVYDSKQVENQKEIAKESILPTVKEIRRGQIIVRRGDPITEIEKYVLFVQEEELSRLRPKIGQWTTAFGNLLLVGILFIILVTYIHYHQPEIFSSNKRLLLLSIIVISTLVFAKTLTYIPISIDKPFWEYFIILPVGAMLIAILMDKELAIISSMIMSMLATVFMGRTLPYTVILLFGSVIAIQSSAGILHRWKFIMSGMFVGIANILAIIMVNLLNVYSPELLSWRVIGYQALGGFVSGLACAMIVDIYMPILEKMFNITTDIRLLELSDLNHPLLRTMITEAPGTYHHSIIVSNMAEDAASGVGANSLLAKVGGYFHDIGKITKPEYFVENTWFEQESRHEKLFPTMSNLVITAHVKDGIQLARKYRLPKLILDIINEHHGTSLVYYFYKKAEKESEKEGSEVSEIDFRYPGPRPSSKESGIILLADAVEAASHTLVKPTPGRIEDLVKEISSEKINDGQLDDCGLTLEDIRIIKERFTHILTGILHKRIEYPDKNGK